MVWDKLLGLGLTGASLFSDGPDMPEAVIPERVEAPNLKMLDAEMIKQQAEDEATSFLQKQKQAIIGQANRAGGVQSGQMFSSMFDVAGGVVAAVGKSEIGISPDGEELPVMSAVGRNRLGLGKDGPIPLIYLGVDVASGPIVLVRHGQVGVSSNGECLPVRSTVGRYRLGLGKSSPVPSIYLGVNIEGRVIAAVGQGQVGILPNREEFPVPRTSGRNYLGNGSGVGCAAASLRSLRCGMPTCAAMNRGATR